MGNIWEELVKKSNCIVEKITKKWSLFGSGWSTMDLCLGLGEYLLTVQVPFHDASYFNRYLIMNRHKIISRRLILFVLFYMQIKLVKVRSTNLCWFPDVYKHVWIKMEIYHGAIKGRILFPLFKAWGSFKPIGALYIFVCSVIIYLSLLENRTTTITKIWSLHIFKSDLNLCHLGGFELHKILWILISYQIYVLWIVFPILCIFHCV